MVIILYMKTLRDLVNTGIVTDYTVVSINIIDTSEHLEGRWYFDCFEHYIDKEYCECTLYQNGNVQLLMFSEKGD